MKIFCCNNYQVNGLPMALGRFARGPRGFARGKGVVQLVAKAIRQMIWKSLGKRLEKALAKPFPKPFPKDVSEV